MQNYLTGHHNLSTKRVINTFASFSHGHWPIISFVIVIFFIIWTTEKKLIYLRDTFRLFLFDWHVDVFFGILFLSTWSSLFLLHCAINYYFPLILVVLCIIYFIAMTSSNRSERKISLTMVQSVIFYYRITFWIFMFPVIFIHYICPEVILDLLVFQWKCISINTMGQWGRYIFMTYECISY
jgi:hypothetical protein